MNWGNGSAVPTSGKNLVIVGTSFPFDYTSADSPAQVNPGQVVELLAGTNNASASATSNTFFQYVGNTALMSPDLATQNYANPAIWQVYLGVLHIRIFGANGNLLTDTDDAELPQTPTELALISTLKRELPTLLAPGYVLTAADTAQVLAEATLIAGQASSQITSIATAVSLAAALSGEVSVAVSLGLSLATNEIDNDVDAYIANASHGVTTKSGGISLTAIENATITSVTAAASLAAAGSLGAGVAISGAGAEATNTILGTDNAYVSASNLTQRRRRRPHALDTSQISAQIISVSASLGVGVGGGGVGASIGISVARNFIGNSVNTSAAYDYLASANVLTLNPGDTVKIDSGARAGDIYEYLGQRPTPSRSTLPPAAAPPPRSSRARTSIVGPGRATDGGGTANTVYQYVGPSRHRFRARTWQTARTTAPTPRCGTRSPHCNRTTRTRRCGGRSTWIATPSR